MHLLLLDDTLLEVVKYPPIQHTKTTGRLMPRLPPQHLVHMLSLEIKRIEVTIIQSLCKYTFLDSTLEIHLGC